jgi:hypothetical protein
MVVESVYCIVEVLYLVEYSKRRIVRRELFS